MASSERGFRERLIDAEPLTPALQVRYDMAVESILDRRLSPWSRIGFASAAVGMATLGLFAVMQASTGSLLPGRRVAWGLVGGGGVGMAAYASRLLLSRALPASFFSQGVVSSAASLLVMFALILFATGVADPASTRILFWCVVGLIVLVISLSVVLLRRIQESENETHERQLKLELKLIEISERTGQLTATEQTKRASAPRRLRLRE